MSSVHVIIPQETSCKGYNVFNQQSVTPGFFFCQLIINIFETTEQNLKKISIIGIKDPK